MSEKKWSILVVDDEWNLRNLIRIYLQNANYELHEAENVKHLVELQGGTIEGCK